MMNKEPSTSHQVNEEVLQMGRGEVDDNERPFYVESVTPVNTKKFRTQAMNYRIFQQILDETIGGVPPQNQVRFVLLSNQLDKPIHFPFMAAERILAKFEHVIQSNQEFRLNDTVEINVIHLSMPVGGKGNKRLEVNLKKHLKKKKSIIRIQNEDELCMAQALVVAKAKLSNDPQYKSIVDHRRPMQTSMAQELHQNAGVPLDPCGIEQAKQF